MKILIVHNYYQLAGGEDSVVNSEKKLLDDAGHDVTLFTKHNNEILNTGRLALAGKTFWAAGVASNFERVVKENKIDIVHVHNTFPLISPAIYWKASELNIPVVQTLHNFRLLCPQAMLMRHGAVCEDCLGHVPWRGVLRKCYRDSFAQTAVISSMVTAHRLLGTWSSKVSKYIALNNFCKEKFIQGGLPAEKMRIKPNFVESTQLEAGPRSGGLFVGRLSREKGVNIFEKASRLFSNAISIRVAGSGPEEGSLRGLKGIQLLGMLNQEQVLAEMRAAQFLVLPSLWYENFPRTIVEAFASGLPVIASRLGAMEEIINHGETGLLFTPGDERDFNEKLEWAYAHPDEMARMGRNARAAYEELYSPAKNYDILMSIYNEALGESLVV